MFLRRAAYIVQFPLAIALPVWVLIGRAFINPGSGWDVAIYFIASPILFIALAIIAGVIVARKSAREERAVTWWDAGLLIALWATLIVHGAIDLPALALLAILLIVSLFWLAIFELVTDTRKRVQTFVDGLALTPQPSRRPQEPRDIGELYVVRPPSDSH